MEHIVIIGGGGTGGVVAVTGPDFPELPPNEGLPPKETWATTGAKGRPKNIVKSLFLDPESLEKNNHELAAKYARWQEDEPTIPDRPFSATGTRNLTEAGRAAIHGLFERSFGPQPED